MTKYPDLGRMKCLCVVFCLSVLFTPGKSPAQTTQQLQEMDDFVQRQQQQSHIPGLAVCLVHDGRIVFAKGYGKTSTGQAVTPHTPFAIASLSKSFTAAAVLQLAEQGKVNIDSPVSTYLAGWPQQLKHITVRELLNQTSGLTDKIFPELKFREQPRDLETAVSRLANVQLKDKPGTKYHYHNPNYQLLARIVETAGGQSFHDYLQENLFRPLHMNETHSLSSTGDFYKTGLTNGYSFLFGRPYAMKEPDWFVAGAAGITSTVNDLAKWIIFNLQNEKNSNDTLLSRKSLEMMQSAPVDVKSPYGMGWQIGNDSIIRHNGILWTYQADLVLMRKQGYGLVLLFNSGLSAFQDYGAFTTGIARILKNEPAAVSNTLLWGNGIMAVFIVIVLTCAFIRFKTMGKWRNKIDEVSRSGGVLNILLRLLPILILRLVPALLTVISGRVLSWPRIFYTMPEIIIWLLLVALFNISVIVARWGAYQKIFRRH